jgi:hypothetical protein
MVASFSWGCVVNAEILKRICELQPSYSPTNTPEMKERGKLIRDALASELRGMLPRISTVVGDAAPDLSVDSSDGIGRKTEAPWVRVHSKSLSPNPRDGYYFVIHFRADGTAVFFTVGCGITMIIVSNEYIRHILLSSAVTKSTDSKPNDCQDTWGGNGKKCVVHIIHDEMPMNRIIYYSICNLQSVNPIIRARIRTIAHHRLLSVANTLRDV